MADIAATWMRGGTSKCWVFQRDELEVPGWSRDDVLLRVFGSPDPRQVDGVGGGTSTTSKAVIVSPSAAGTDWDVDYTFAQVGIEEQRVDWGSNCGNCSSVIGLYAVRNGWVPAVADETVVRVHNTNTNQLIMLHVRTPGGVVDETRDRVHPGRAVPGHQRAVVVRRPSRSHDRSPVSERQRDRHPGRPRRSGGGDTD